MGRCDAHGRAAISNSFWVETRHYFDSRPPLFSKRTCILVRKCTILAYLLNPIRFQATSVNPF